MVKQLLEDVAFLLFARLKKTADIYLTVQLMKWHHKCINELFWKFCSLLFYDRSANIEQKYVAKEFRLAGNILFFVALMNLISV